MAILDEIKNALSVVDNHADAILTTHIETVENYLRGAGVDETIIGTKQTTGAILRGVCDLWNAGSGDVSFSPVFYDLVIQLAVTNPGGGGNASTLS